MMLPRLQITAGLVLLAVAATGCSGRQAPDLQAVSGLVTINQQPLNAGRIVFRPLQGTEGRASSAGIQQGEFRILRDDGLVPGKYRVEIEAVQDLGFAIDDDVAFAQRGGKPLPPNPVPAKFNRKSELTATVAANQDNSLQFDLDVADSQRK